MRERIRSQLFAAARAASPYYLARLEGRVVGSEEHVSLLVFGKPWFAHEVCPLFLASDAKITVLRRFPPFLRAWGEAVTWSSRNAKDDAVLLQTRTLSQPSFPAVAAMTMVDAVVDMDAPPEESIEGRLGAKRRWAIRDARRQGFHSRVGRDLSDVSTFHARLYTPMVKSRHGERGVLLPLARVQREFTAGRDMVLFVEHEGRLLAGGILQHDAVLPHVDYLHFGASPEAIADRALYGRVTAFLYSELFRVAWESGARKFGLGAATPLLTNGGLLQKKRFGCRLVPSRYGTPFTLSLARPEGARLLRHAPLVAWEEDGFHGVTARPADETCDGPFIRELVSFWKEGPLRRLDIATDDAATAKPTADAGLPLRPIPVDSLVRT